MQKKRSTKVSNRVIMVVLILTVAVAVIGTFFSLMDVGVENVGITGATPIDNGILEEANNRDVEVNETQAGKKDS